ncbi:MAG TPA: hypothetical protein VKY31_08410, partial [Terriglobia bacterium]|nr:hypothetical protein [Terriglobia bacterium]
FPIILMAGPQRRGGGAGRAGGGAARAGGGTARTSGAASVNRDVSSTSIRSSQDVNRSVTRNGDLNRNVDVDRDLDVHGDINGRYDRWGHPVAAGAAVGAAAGAAIGSSVAVLPPSCSTVVVNGTGYSQCGSTWYEPYYSGTEVQYMAVNPPQ